MSIFKTAKNNLTASFDINHIAQIKQKQKEILGLLDDKKKLQAELLNELDIIDKKLDCLINNCSQIIDQLREINGLQNTLIINLNSKDLNFQNKWAQKHGMKSAMQYKLSLNKKRNENLVEIEQKQNLLIKYEKDKDLNYKKKEKYLKELSSCENEIEFYNNNLKDIENALIFYKGIRNISICSSISAIFIYLCFIFTNLVFSNNFPFIFCVTSLFIVTVSSFCGYSQDKLICKRLFLDKVNIGNYCFPILLCSILLVFTLKNIVASWISIVLFALIIFMTIYNILSIVRISEKNEQFYLPTDFIYLNLPLLNVVALYIMFFSSINPIINYITTGLFSLVVILYFITFCWIFKREFNKTKIDFKFCILTIINIAIFLIFATLIIIHLLGSIFIPSWLLSIIVTTLFTITAPIFRSLFKPTIKDPIEKNDESIEK